MAILILQLSVRGQIKLEFHHEHSCDNCITAFQSVSSPNSRNESEKVLGICDAIKCPPRFSKADSQLANI